MGDRLRLWLCRLLCPPTHRLIEVGDALARGGDCDPVILWNVAAHMQRGHYMGQIIAECDCDQAVSCTAAGRCLAAEGKA